MDATEPEPAPARAMLIPYAGRSPTIDPQAWLAPNAVLVGDVSVRAGAQVHFGAVLRADMAAVTVCEAADLGDNVVVHTARDYPTFIGREVRIGPAAVVHGCTIEAGCLVGANATVLNGAVVGAGSVIAAGAVVLQGTQIPPRSLVAGIPGRVQRELSVDEVV